MSTRMSSDLTKTDVRVLRGETFFTTGFFVLAVAVFLFAATLRLGAAFFRPAVFAFVVAAFFLGAVFAFALVFVAVVVFFFGATFFAAGAAGYGTDVLKDSNRAPGTTEGLNARTSQTGDDDDEAATTRRVARRATSPNMWPSQKQVIQYWSWAWNLRRRESKRRQVSNLGRKQLSKYRRAR